MEPGTLEFGELGESLLPQRAFPPDRDRAARLPGEPDTDPEVEERAQGGPLRRLWPGSGGPGQVRRLQPEQALDQRRADLGDEGDRPLRKRSGAAAVPEPAPPAQRQL